jgi:hypothetical protein
MVSRTGKLQDEKLIQPYPISNVSFLRNDTKHIDADEPIFETLAESKAEIQKIVQRFGYVLKLSRIQNKLSDENFVGSMLNDICKLAFRDLNCMMRSAIGFRWIDLKLEEFKIETYKPDSALSKLELGKYEKDEKKCSINLELFTRIFLKPRERWQTSITEKQLAEFLEGIYSTMIHEGFHAVQNSILNHEGNIKNRVNTNNINNFIEGGARFVEIIASSLITAGKHTGSNSSNSLERTFLWHFAIEPVSSAVNDEADKIKDMLENFIPHNIGMFVFAVRYVANGSFISTLSEICKMAEERSISNEELYQMLYKDIENGNLAKLRQKIHTIIP